MNDSGTATLKETHTEVPMIRAGSLKRKNTMNDSGTATLKETHTEVPMIRVGTPENNQHISTKASSGLQYRTPLQPIRIDENRNTSLTESTTRTSLTDCKRRSRSQNVSTIFGISRSPLSVNGNNKSATVGTIQTLKNTAVDVHHDKIMPDSNVLKDTYIDVDNLPNYYPDLWQCYMDIGPSNKMCNKCGATIWNGERNNKSSGGKIDNKINRGNAPYCFRLEGQNYHLVGSLVLVDGSSPKFCQLYIYDTENEVENRLNALGCTSDSVDPELVEELLAMLDKNNQLVKAFRMARNRFENNDLDEFKLVLISSKSSGGRPYPIGPSNEVAAFIVSDNTNTGGFRDTVVNSKQEGLKRIYETDPHFMQLQYPLLFPFGNEGFHLHIPLISNKYSERENLDDEDLDPDDKSRRHVSMKEYYCYKIMIRTSEGHDTATMLLKKNTSSQVTAQEKKAKSLNEVKDFLDGRYLHFGGGIIKNKPWHVFTIARGKKRADYGEETERNQNFSSRGLSARSALLSGRAES
ncbi:hypothetical protein AgCh_001090 [Apium graveolens]